MKKIKHIIMILKNWLRTRYVVKQFLQFGFVGMSNTLLSVAAYTMLVYFGMHYLIANAFSYILGTLNSFYWNNKYVFKVENDEKRSLVLSFLKMTISYAFTGILLNSLLSIFWIEIMNTSEYIAPYFNMVITIPLNFVMNKFWAMK